MATLIKIVAVVVAWHQILYKTVTTFSSRKMLNCAEKAACQFASLADFVVVLAACT